LTVAGWRIILDAKPSRSGHEQAMFPLAVCTQASALRLVRSICLSRGLWLGAMQGG